jgi:ankyrin repeat protein
MNLIKDWFKQFDYELEEIDDINAILKNGKTLLGIFCHHDEIEIVEYLLKQQKIDINKVDKFGKCPLYYACEFGNLKSIKLLKESKKGLRFDEKSINLAISNNHYLIIHYLFSDRIDKIPMLYLEKNNINTLIMRGSFELAAIWLVNGIDPYINHKIFLKLFSKEEENKLLINLIIEKMKLNQQKILIYLNKIIDYMRFDLKLINELYFKIKYSFKIDDYIKNKFINEFLNNMSNEFSFFNFDIEYLKFVIEELGLDVNSKHRGKNILYCMINKGKIKECIYLCNKGANINENVDDEGKTMLFGFFIHNKEILSIILILGCDPKIKDNKGKSVIFDAISKRCTILIKLLFALDIYSSKEIIEINNKLSDLDSLYFDNILSDHPNWKSNFIKEYNEIKYKYDEILETSSIKLFVNIQLIYLGYLRLSEESRFFNCVLKLPSEIQMKICGLVFNYKKEFFSQEFINYCIKRFFCDHKYVF